MYGYETPKDRKGRNVHEIKKLEGFEHGNKKWQMNNRRKLRKELKVQKCFYQLLWWWNIPVKTGHRHTHTHTCWDFRLLVETVVSEATPFLPSVMPAPPAPCRHWTNQKCWWSFVSTEPARRRDAYSRAGRYRSIPRKTGVVDWWFFAWHRIFDHCNGWCDILAGTRVGITRLVVEDMAFLRSRPR
jgi:hypothetical protein